jgi:hypothetical protein
MALNRIKQKNLESSSTILYNKDGLADNSINQIFTDKTREYLWIGTMLPA